MTKRVVIARGDSHTFTGKAAYPDETVPASVETGEVTLYVRPKGEASPVITAGPVNPTAGTGAYSITLAAIQTRTLLESTEYDAEVRYVNGSVEDQMECFTLEIKPSIGAPAS